MQIDILTMFPKMFSGPLTESILARAQKKGIIKIKIHDLKKWGLGSYKKVDDKPYGGGSGMVMRIDIIDKALKSVTKGKKPYVILLSAKGKTFSQEKAQQLSNKKHLVFLCGHYEGVDERIFKLVTEEISIGDYILTGGELPAMVLIDSIARLIPGVIGKESSLSEESFSKGLAKLKSPSSILPLIKGEVGGGNKFLEYPHYTRPEIYQGKKVPSVLLSGHHAKIKEWRRKHTRSKK